MNPMNLQLDSVLNDFKRIPCLVQARQWHLVQVEFCDAPHQPPGPLPGRQAAYLFFRGQEWLRIGQTGYSAHFTSQHYGTRRAGSTFAKDVWINRSDFGFRGTESKVGDWIKQNCGRANVTLPRNRDWPKSVLVLLESYLHYRLNPRFEGRRG